MHETLSLRNDGNGFAHEGRQPPLGRISCLAMPEIALRRRAKNRQMIWQGFGDFVEEVRPLRQVDAVIAVAQPVLQGSRRVHHLLQAKNIGIG
ncbi:hypothetical protein D3C78_1787370 [compost metagenome]